MINTKFSLTATPHSGYHWDNRHQRFFEGWYYRVTLPDIEQGFGFMYSIDDPWGNQPHSGGAVQILGIDGEYRWRTFPNVKGFWASKDQLGLGHWRKTPPNTAAQLLSPEQFSQSIIEGYQATATLNQGFIHDPTSPYPCRWQYQIEPIYSWGIPSQATAGWLSYLPIFDPGWQVLMAQGRATGWIDWNGKRYDFDNAPAYSEKNWGRSFPQKWFWINGNCFEHEPDLAITAVGGKRQRLGSTEDVGLIGIHYKGQFYEFAPWNARIGWKVQPWGRWEMTADNGVWQVSLTGITTDEGTWVRVPTEDGLHFRCRDTLNGFISLILRDCQGQIHLKARTRLGGLEIGGFPWDEPWIYGLN